MNDTNSCWEVAAEQRCVDEREKGSEELKSPFDAIEFIYTTFQHEFI